MAVEASGAGRAPPIAPLICIAVAAWIILNAAAFWLSGGLLPFDRPALAGLPFAAQMGFPTVGLAEIFLLMGIVWWMTRRRAIPDIAARAPERALAAREAALVIGWALAGQAAGWLIGPLLGYRSFSFHLAGTLVGCTLPPSPGEALLWAGYNFLVFAAIPYLWFRRHYSHTELNLRSTAPRNDLAIILVVGVIETASELLAFPGIFKLTPHQLAIAGPLSFLIFGLGTVLPTMVLIYPAASLSAADWLEDRNGPAGRAELCGHAPGRGLVELLDAARRGAVRNVRGPDLPRAWDVQVVRHLAHRQRVDPRHRLPRHRPARGGRRAPGRQGLRDPLRQRLTRLNGACEGLVRWLAWRSATCFSAYRASARLND
jgi:hypothetical protein